MSKQKVIITGASGFVGKDLLKFLDLNLYEISVITRDKQKLENKFDSSVRIVEADLMDVSSLKKAFENQDVLINLAAEVRNHDLLEKTNVQGTKNLIEAIQHARINKVIHLSSVGVVGKPYSNIAIKINEDVEPTPQNDYERTKNISEQLLNEAAVSNAFDLVVLRPTNVFGENHPFNALLNLMQTVENGKPLITTKGAKVNYVYVSDVSASIISALENKTKNGIYNVGYSMDLNEFYSVIMNAMKLKIRIFSVPSILTSFTYKLGVKKLQSISNRLEYSDNQLRENFSYPFGIEMGIKNTVEHYKKQGVLK
ncbi:MAG: NAD(P)-dependent oxidoreductase [Crocinitomicaceae bacterium]